MRSPDPSSQMDRSEASGLVNAHTHLYSALAVLGMPAPDPAPTNFLEILERVWWRLDRALDADSLRAGAELYVAEALDFGTTTLIDHHESPNFIEGSLDVLAEVCEELGMRALLVYGVTERNGGEHEARRGLAENERLLARLAKSPSKWVRGGVGIHASFTVSDATLRRAAELAAEYAAPLHIHVAEDLADVEDAHRRGFAGVVDRLEQLGALRPGAILAHGVHLTRDEVRRIDAAGAWLVQNPRSNRGNGVGYPAHLAAASRVALGTDGFPADMRAEEAVLLEDAAANGELEAARGRLAAGASLAAELFPHAAPRARALALPPERIAAIRHRAQEQAVRLFARMAAL